METMGFVVGVAAILILCTVSSAILIPTMFPSDHNATTIHSNHTNFTIPVGSITNITNNSVAVSTPATSPANVTTPTIDPTDLTTPPTPPDDVTTPTPEPANVTTPTPEPLPTTIHMYGQAFYNNYVTPCPGAAVTFLVLGIYDDAHGNQICMQRDVVGTAVTDADGKYSCEISVNVLQDAIAALNAQAPILGAGYHDVQFGILPCEASEVNSYPHSGNQYWFMSIPYAGGSYNTNVVVDVPAPVLSPTPTLSPTPVVEPDQKYYTSIWVLESGTYNNGNKQIADAIVTIRHNGVIIAVCNGGSGVMEYSTRSGSFEYTYDATAPGYKESTGSFNPVPGSTFVIDLEPV